MNTTKLKVTKKSIFFRSTVFLFIFAGLFVCLNYLFQPVFVRERNYLSKRYFYNEPDNSVEIIFLGASISYHGITPMELYEKYGICAYDLGTSTQPVHSSYYWLEESYRLHGETLKTVVFDVSVLRSDKDESWYRLATDAMNYSSVKWRAVSDYTDGFEDTLTYFSPLFAYHGRWTELTKADFTKLGYDERNYLRGYYFNTSNKYFTDHSYTDLFVPDYYPDYGSDEMELKTESLYYLKQMIDFCKVHGIRLVLIKTPGQSIGVSGHNAVQRIADEYGLDYLDFNFAPLIDEIGYNHATDSSDGSHMNYYGARKLTAWLGNYLVEECGATDVRGMEDYEFMEEELAEYHSQVTDVVALKSVTDPAEYLSLAFSDERNYIIFVAVKDDAAGALTEKQRQVFASLGLDSLSKMDYQASYLAVIDSGVVLCEHMEADPRGAEEDEIRNDLESITMEDVRQNREDRKTEEPAISYGGILPDGTAYVLISGGYNAGNIASLTLDGVEYAAGTRGLNIILYDKVKKEVIDSAVFDTCKSSVRDGGDLENALLNALKYTDDYGTLSPDLQKLYLYNLRCENARNQLYPKQLAKEGRLLTYLDDVLSNEDYAVFLSVKDEASEGLGDEARDALLKRGFEALSELEHRDSYLAVILGGTLVYEARDHGEETISVSDAWVPGTDGGTGILYSVTSGGYESGNVSSILIDGVEYSANSRGINVVVWDTVSNIQVASVTFDTYDIPVRLGD